MLDSAKLTDVILSNKTMCALYDKVPVSYLHSEDKLDKATYQFVGEIKQEDVTTEYKVAVLDAFACRQRHSQNGQIKRIRLGGYRKQGTNDMVSLKLVVAIKDNSMFIVTQKSNSKVEDIAPRMPLRVGGLFSAHKTLNR